MASTADFDKFAECVADAFILPETSKDTRFRNCTHVLCLECLTSIRERSGGRLEDSIKCNICCFEGALSSVNEHDEASPDLIRGLLRSCLEVSETIILCQSCSYPPPAIGYCKQCKKHLCDMCALRDTRSGHYEFSELSSHIFDDKSSHQSAHVQLEICCVVCKIAGCIVCLIKSVDPIKSKLFTLTETVNAMKQQLSEDVQKAEKEELLHEDGINGEIQKLNERLKECNHLGKEFKSKQKERKETDWQMESRLHEIERHLRWMTESQARLLTFDLNDWKEQCKRTLKLERKVGVCSEHLAAISHSRLKDSNVQDNNPTEEDDPTKNASTVGNDRVSDGSRTFQIHTNENSQAPVSADLVSGIERYHKLLDKLSSTTRNKQGRTLIWINSRDSTDLDAAFERIDAIVRRLLPEENVKEWKAIQNLHGTVVSMYSGILFPETGTPSLSIALIEELKRSLKMQLKNLRPSKTFPVARDKELVASQRFLPQSPVSTLANLGNTCFLNVILQALCHTKIFVKLLARKFPISDGSTGVVKLATEFSKLASSMLSGDGKCPYFPTELYIALQTKLRKFTNSGQHDSRDLLIHLLNRIRQEERDASLDPRCDSQRFTDRSNPAGQKSNPIKSLTTVDEVFGGHILTVYICNGCFEPYLVCEPFLDLSLPIYEGRASFNSCPEASHFFCEIGQKGSPYQKAVYDAMKPFDGSELVNPGKLENSVVSSLNHFTRFEYIDSEYLCTKCSARANEQKMTSALKRTLIFNPPAVLSIHLKRFQQTLSSFVKNDKHIEFNYHLDIAPFCSSGCLNADPGVKNIWYALYAVVVHSGSLDGGHYVIYVMVRENQSDVKDFLQKEFLDFNTRFSERGLIKRMEKISTTGRKYGVSPKSKPGTWYRINDNQCDMVRVYTGSMDEVLRQNAYMLFYERVPTAP